MQKRLLGYSAMAIVTVFALSLAGSAAARELPQRAEEARVSAQETREAAQLRHEVQTQMTDKREAAKAKLEEKKLKACQNREKAINNIMARMSDRGEKHLAVFTKISDRVQAFYEDKDLTVGNYEELVADVDDKRAAAEASVAAVRESSVEFKCDGSDPKGTASHFLEKRKDMHEALKAYKTSVRNLIVAVKTSIGEQEGEQQ